MRARRYILSAVVVFASAVASADDTAVTTPQQADALAAALLKRFGSGYVSRVDHARKLLFVSAIEKTHFEHTTALLNDFADAQHKTLLTAGLQWYVTIILPTARDYARLRPKAAVMGFYSPSARALISIDRGRVLLHEFTHALHHADASASGQHHPLWIAEGLSTLYESAKITPAGLKVSVDSRIGWLRRGIDGGYLPPLASLLGADSKQFMRDARTAYAQARYLMLYLHQAGKLAQWYQDYKNTFADDPTGRVALEKTLGKPLTEIDQNYRAWIMRLNVPAAVRKSPAGRLGIQVADSPKGVRIVSMTARGAAAQAGQLRAGDVIVAINHRRVRTVKELGIAMDAAAEMNTIPITVRRNGQMLTVDHPMAVARGGPSDSR